MNLIPRFAFAAVMVFSTSLWVDAATTQKTTRYEAEDALIVGGGAVVVQSNASAGEYYDYAITQGDYLEWTITVENAGTAELVFGYASASSTDRPLQIKVNGTVVAASHSFPTTGGWTTWGKATALNVSLNAGTNTVRATAANNIGPNMDYLQVKEILPLSGQIMTVYAGANLTGTSANVGATHVVYTGATIPGGLDNQISSFVLTQGYMAVVADPADGIQPSKVYIAANGSLTINTLPTDLENAISFIRVVPWKQTEKKGFCGGDDAYRSKFDHSWYYSWTKGVERGQRTFGPEFAPMCWDEKYVQIEDFLAQDQATHLLSFNEPDGVNQANMPIILDAVTLHKELQKAGLRLGSPACEEQDTYGSAGKWLPDFMTEANAQGVRVDYINVHWYDWGNSPDTYPNPNPIDVANRLKTYLANVYAHHRKPIWITEFNANPARPRSVHDGFLQEILPYLDDVGYVERYAYYQWPATAGATMYFVEPSDGSLTTTGQIYNNHQSPLAYVSGELPSPWQSSDVGTTNVGASLYNGNFTISGSGTGLSGTVDGCRHVYQSVSGDVTVTAKVTGQIYRNNLSMSGVMIRESQASNSKQATMALSWNQGSKFRVRATTGGSVTATGDSNAPKYPYWVRLVRQGNTFTGYQSPDGVTWTQAGTPTTIVMSSEVQVGLAVTSYSDGSFNDAIFKHVSVTQTLGQSIYIDWTRSTFSGTFTNTPMTNNPDGDASVNLQEFAFGTDPTSSILPPVSFDSIGGTMQAGAPTLMKLPVSGQPDAFHAVFSRRMDRVIAGLTYSVEFSADLVRWTSSSAGLLVRVSVGNMETVSVPFPATVPVNAVGQPDAAPKFFRVAVSQ